MSETVRMRIWWLASECRNCGKIDPFGVRLIHAKGEYCRDCAPIISQLAQAHRDKEISRMMTAGVMSIPVPLYDPFPIRKRSNAP